MTYSRVRTETHAAREYLVLNLHQHPQVLNLWEDGSDLVAATFRSGAKLMIYLVDDYLSLHELQKILGENQAKGQHTLFFFWAEMLLPNDGERFMPQDWMMALLSLHGEKIYAYEVNSTEVFMFPVYFQAIEGQHERHIRWGKTLNWQHIRLRTRPLETPHLKGDFLLGDFSPPQLGQGPKTSPPAINLSPALQAHYRLLGLEDSADLEAIKQAYRDLARQYHPDLNPAPEATSKMQALNAAYAQILAAWENTPPP
jgi:hypothetical protein